LRKIKNERLLITETEKTTSFKGVSFFFKILSVLKSARKSFELIETRSVKENAGEFWKGIEGKYKRESF